MKGSRNVTRRQHRRFREVIDAFVDAELDDDAARSVAMHLDDCWGCSSAAETATLIKRSLRLLPSRQPSPLAAARMHRYAQRLARA